MKELTPEEKALQMEGEALLRKVAGGKSPAIVGPDGLPMKDPDDTEDKGKSGVLTSEEEGRRAAREAIDKRVAELREANRKERDEALARMAEVCKENNIAKQCVQTILHAHRLIAWAKLEMQTLDERVDDKALMHLERQVHGAVYSGGDYTSQSLAIEVRKRVCDFIDERNRYYADQIRKRKAKISKIVKRLKRKGITLPCKYMENERDKKLNGNFGLGSIAVLYGEQKAVSAAVRIFGVTHSREDLGQSHHLVCEDTVPAAYCEDVTLVAGTWWRNSLSSVCKFYDTLEPAVDSPSTMLLVDNLNEFLLAPDTQMSVSERKSRVLTALRQWAVEHAVVVIVGDPVDLSIAKDAKYGGLACAPVRFENKDGAVQLLIGEDVIDVRDLKLEAE